MSSGRNSTARSSSAGHFERLHQPLLEAEVLQAAALRQRDRQRLQVVVAQHQRRHVVGHLRQQHVAVVAGETAVAHRHRERDLEVDLDVGGVDAGRIVDGVGVEPDAVLRRLDPAALRHAEIGALADHLAAQIVVAVVRIASLARSPTASSVSVEART